MNYNQQVQGYNCNGCLKPFSFNEVKRHCLNDNRGIRLYCVLCPGCSHNQFSSKAKIGLFPLLTDYEKLNSGLKEIKTSEFEKNEVAEIRFQQEQLNYRQQQLDQSLFDCDKCRNPIVRGEEKENFLARYKPNTSIASDVKWRILCLPCEKPLNKDLVPNTILNQAENVERTPTSIRYWEYIEKLKDQSNPMAKREKQVEEERQAKMKKEQEKWGF